MTRDTQYYSNNVYQSIQDSMHVIFELQVHESRQGSDEEAEEADDVFYLAYRLLECARIPLAYASGLKEWGHLKDVKDVKDDVRAILKDILEYNCK